MPLHLKRTRVFDKIHWREARQDEGWSVEWVGPYRGGNAGLHTHTHKRAHIGSSLVDLPSGRASQAFKILYDKRLNEQ